MNRLALVSFAAVATLVTLSGTAAAQQVFSPDAQPATVVVTAGEQMDVKIGVVTGRASAVASDGTTISAMGTKDICIAPCKFELQPGLQELTASGPFYTAGVQQVSLQPGENRFRVKPGNGLARMGSWILVAGGIAGLATGITVAAVGSSHITSRGTIEKTTPGWAVPVAIGGGVALAGGVVTYFASSTTFAREPGPPQRVGSVSGLSYALKF